jgi:hypothetical protein
MGYDINIIMIIIVLVYMRIISIVAMSAGVTIISLLSPFTLIETLERSCLGASE